MDSHAGRSHTGRGRPALVAVPDDRDVGEADGHVYARILVAVGGSHESHRPLEAALRLARDQQAQVRIVHVIDTVPHAISAYPVPDFEAYRQASLRAGREVLDAADAVARASGVSASVALVAIDSTHSNIGIVREAVGWSADLIVMGTHGRRRLLHVLRGSIAEAVVWDAPMPVLLVRANGLPDAHMSR